MQYKYPDYETNPFGFLEENTTGNLNKFYDYSNKVVEMFKVIDDSIAPGVKEDMYAISNYGRVINIRTGHELSLIQNDNGYLSTGLQMKDNSRRLFLDHRLVANAFIDKTQEDIDMGRNIINHKDLNTAHNEPINLEYNTFRENNIHAKINNAVGKNNKKEKNNWSNGNITCNENNGMARITNEQVHIICQSLVNGDTCKQASINAGLEGNLNDTRLAQSISCGKRHKNISKEYGIPLRKNLI